MIQVTHDLQTTPTHAKVDLKKIKNGKRAAECSTVRKKDNKEKIRKRRRVGQKSEQGKKWEEKERGGGERQVIVSIFYY